MEALSNTRIFKLFLMLWLLPLGACNPQAPLSAGTASPDSARTSVSQPTATATEAQPTPTAEPTAAPRYQVNEPADTFTATQEQLNQADTAQAQKDRMQRWLDYWIQFENRPFAENSQEIHWKYIYDNAKDPKEILALIEVGGKYQNKLFTVPMNEEGFVDYPPLVEGETIEAGLGPLEVSAGIKGQYLAVEEGWLIRKAAGRVVEKLVQGHWEAVEAYPIDLEKFNTMPPSYEDVVANPEKYQEAPDFFGETEAAMKWWKETLIPTLGDQRELTPNVFGKALGDDEVRGEY